MNRVRRSRLLGSFQLSIAFLLATVWMNAQVPYKIIDLGTLGGSSSYGTAINASGQVTGYSTVAGDPSFCTNTGCFPVVHPFFMVGTSMLDLGTLGGSAGYGAGINASGQVSGSANLLGDINTHAFFYGPTQNLGMENLGTLSGGLGLGGPTSQGNGINAFGQVAGWSDNSVSGTRHAVIWNGTAITDLGALGSGVSKAFGINDSGQVVGESDSGLNTAIHAVLWNGTSIVDLGTLGGSYSHGYAINASGQVAGQSAVTGTLNECSIYGSICHAFVWNGTSMADLGTLGGSTSVGYGINASGQVVGTSSLVGDFYLSTSGFLWNGTSMVNLSSLIVNLGGWTQLGPKAINDAGQITGSGVINGQTHAFLLTPATAGFFLDTTTQGSWNGKYGADGYMIANGATMLPSYASVSTTASTFNWVGSTTDVRALQNGKGSSDRIASTYIPANYGNSISVNVNLTDGKTHQVALYFLDWDTTSRSQTVTITDASTNAIVDTETITNFHGGTYAVWSLKGNSIIKVAGTGSDAVLSGIFFDPSSGGATLPPSFSLNAKPATVSIAQAASSTVSVNVTPINGFNSPVTLITPNWPNFISGTFGTNPTTGSTSLTISVGPLAAPGSYVLPINGSSGGLVAETSIALTVTAGPPSLGFTLSATPATAAAGTYATFTVSVARAGGFNSQVTLEAVNWPAGVNGYFVTNPAMVTTDGRTPPGSYTLTIKGTSGALTNTTTLALTVTAALQSFTISQSHVYATNAGSTVYESLTANPQNLSFDELLPPTVSAWPSGFSLANFLVAQGVSIISVGVNVANSVAQGTYSLPTTFTTSAGLTASATIIVIVGDGAAATYVGIDTSTQGNWIGKYGSDGFLIANSIHRLPTYDQNGNMISAPAYTWAAATTDPRALQTAAGSNVGIASEYYGGTFSIDVYLTDGNTHQVALYLLDWDTTSRVEQITIVDPVDGSVLSQQSFTGFHNGVWAVWNLTGHVTIKVQSPSSAAVSGIFFGPVSGPSPSFTLSTTPVTIPSGSSGNSTVTVTPSNGFNSPVTLTPANWPLGISGSFTPNATFDTSSAGITVATGVAPGSYTLTVNGTGGGVNASTTIALTVTAAASPSFTLSATAATATAGSSGTSTVTVTPVNGFNSAVTLAPVGWPNGVTGVFATNPTTGSSSVTISVASSVAAGPYSLTVSGTSGALTASGTIALTVNATTTGGGPSATYTGTDSTTQGAWIGTYGADGLLIANGINRLPPYASLNVIGASTYTWGAATTDPRALQTAAGSKVGIASEYYGGTFSFDLNLTDGNTHQVALYLLDWDTTSRVEQIVVVDRASGNVLSRQFFSGFHNGQWAIFNLTGHVIIGVGSSSSAAVSGIFFGPVGGPLPSYSLSATPATAAAGSFGTSTVTITPPTGFNSPVTLAASNWPSGITGTFGTNPTTSSSSLTINVASSVAAGPYLLTVTGSGGASTTIPLTVFPAPPPSYSLSVTPATINAGSSGTSAVTINAANGFNSPVTLAASNWPSGITGTFGTNPTTGSSSLTINVASSVAAGPYSLTVTGSGGASTIFPLTVTAAAPPPSFTLSATPATINAGSSGTSTITVIPANGFNSPVTFATANAQGQPGPWPAGITGTFTPNPTTGSTVVTINVAANVAPGPYGLQITATSAVETVGSAIGLTVTSSSSGGPSATFLGLDTTTQGAWGGTYGTAGYTIANGATAAPVYGYATVNGAQTYTWVGATNDPRALQTSPGSAVHIASAYTQYANTSFMVSVNLLDTNVHKISLYLLDWDTTSRTETITVMDAATNAVLDTETVTSFHNGQYASWNVKGNVIIKVMPASGVSPVLSGIFFN